MNADRISRASAFSKLSLAEALKGAKGGRALGAEIPLVRLVSVPCFSLQAAVCDGCVI